jgi:hypothetical protein
VRIGQRARKGKCNPFLAQRETEKSAYRKSLVSIYLSLPVSSKQIGVFLHTEGNDGTATAVSEEARYALLTSI